MEEFGTFSLSSGDIPFLSLKTSSEGGLLLNTKVVDSTGHEIVSISDNDFKAVPAYAFNPRMPDPHTIIVRDSKKVEVLNVKYDTSAKTHFTKLALEPVFEP